MDLSQVSPAQLREAAALKEQIVQLETELESILGTASAGPGRKHWSQTPAGRAKLARNARKRWRRDSKPTAKKNGTRVHWTQTRTGRAKMARLMHGRWDSRRKKAA